MRPNQNRRMRGRNRPKGPNPLTRSYESNGPDVKIRGTAQHIADKYAQLARDALAAGDPVAAENYFQHGEHYFRIISGAQEQARPAPGGYAARAFDDEGDEGEDEVQGQGGQPNGHAYNGQGYAQDEYGDASQQPQPYEGRQDGYQDGGRQNRDRFQNRDQRRFDNQARHENNRQDYNRDRPRQDGNRQDYGRQEHSRQENFRQENSRQDNGRQDYPRQDYRGQDGNRQDQPRQDYQPRGERSEYREARQDRPERQDRQDRPERQDRAERQDRPERQERRDFRPEAPRGEVPRAEGNSRRERRREEPAAVSDESNALPAFLMAPARPAAPTAAPEPEPTPTVVETAAEETPAPKPRRRRRPRFESAATEGSEGPAPSSDDSASE